MRRVDYASAFALRATADKSLIHPSILPTREFVYFAWGCFRDLSSGPVGAAAAVAAEVPAAWAGVQPRLRIVAAAAAIGAAVPARAAAAGDLDDVGRGRGGG